MAYQFRTLLMASVLSAVVLLMCVDGLHHSYGGDTPSRLLSPIETIITERQNGDLFSNRITYSVENYGITEFGNVRLAVEGKPFSGRSSGGLLLATKSYETSRSSGSTGVGNRRFEHKTIAGGSSCKFGGLSFEIVYGRLMLLGETIPVDKKPTLIIVNSKGEIDSIVALTTGDEEESK